MSRNTVLLLGSLFGAGLPVLACTGVLAFEVSRDSSISEIIASPVVAVVLPLGVLAGMAFLTVFLLTRTPSDSFGPSEED